MRGKRNYACTRAAALALAGDQVQWDLLEPRLHVVVVCLAKSTAIQ
jgi:hypothetical protein